MVKQIKPNTQYRLLNLETGTYLTRSGNDQHSVIGHKYSNRNGQLWLFQTSANRYFIKSVDSKLYVTLPTNDADLQEGKQLQCTDIPFAWKVLDVPNIGTAVRLVPEAATDLYVDLFEASPENGTKIQLWPLTGNNQIWVLEEVRGHY